jgi:hypothetical protein
MTYQVYKSTNKGRSWALQGTTDIIPQGSFFPGQEGFSFAYSQFRQTTSGSEIIDGYITSIAPGGIGVPGDVFSITISAPDDPLGTQAVATPVVTLILEDPPTVGVTSVTIDEGGSGYGLSPPTVTLLKNGVFLTTLTPTVEYRPKYITYTLSGITWTQNVVTALGTSENYIGQPSFKFGNTYFATLLDIPNATANIFVGSNPQALANSNLASGTELSRINEINGTVYIVVDNSLYRFSGNSWVLVGTLYDETNEDSLYPNYFLKDWVTTSQGTYAYVTDSTETTAYIYQTEDLLNYTRVQTVGSVATYPLANQGTYLYTDNSAAFTATNNLLELQ